MNIHFAKRLARLLVAVARFLTYKNPSAAGYNELLDAADNLEVYCR